MPVILTVRQRDAINGVVGLIAYSLGARLMTEHHVRAARLAVMAVGYVTLATLYLAPRPRPKPARSRRRVVALLLGMIVLLATIAWFHLLDRALEIFCLAGVPLCIWQLGRLTMRPGSGVSTG